ALRGACRSPGELAPASGKTLNLAAFLALTGRDEYGTLRATVTEESFRSIGDTAEYLAFY
ncbi:MAG: hypothetical protein ACE5JQ_15635, partial [Candidatus Methylomirabilales bacterium]